ncbi:MAG: cytochrome c [Chitinophagaceae bacterium]|jgi:hypothetical protein
MNSRKILFLALSTALIYSCSSSKKTAKTSDSSVAPAAPVVSEKPDNGIYEPGQEELTAIQVQFKDATLAQLKEGHVIYAQGACINCHGAKNIYKRSTASWKEIIDDMAQRAKISASQKDAVYKYVMAIKAKQSGGQQFNMTR